MKNILNEETLNAYRTYIPHGKRKEIAEKAGVSRQTVYDFLKGKRYNAKVEFAVLDVVTGIKSQREKKLKKAGLL